VKTISEAKVRSIIREEIQMVLLEAGMFDEEEKALKDLLKSAVSPFVDSYKNLSNDDKKTAALIYLLATGAIGAVPTINTLKHYSPGFDNAFVEFFNAISPEGSKPLKPNEKHGDFVKDVDDFIVKNYPIKRF